ncbi:MAG: type III pantothenate kinase [Gemmatimonadetes bacterium]|nr:MAG: type III pantothenate kinase [Gemmatimonadota bacterium]PYP26283.1 MAG: type III pantothenate kinase [Gemmatimonadota bacterium]
MCCRARSPRRRCTTGCTTPRSRRWAAHRLPPVVPAWRAASRSPAPPRSPSRSDGWCGAVAGASRPVYLSPPMLLAININNTETKAGLFRGDSLEAHWRLTTAPARTSDEWAAAFTAFLLQAGRSTQEVRAAVVASVVPPVTQGICEAVERATTIAPVIVDGRSALPITLDVEEPLSVGADRILNTLAASQLFRRDTIVVDFGTATTFDCITGDGRFIGGVIMPGVRTAADALIRNTAKLPATELTPPERVIGRRTEECIRAGVLLGAAEAVDGLVRRIKAEWPNGRTPHVIATGGLASLVAPLARAIEAVHPDLTLAGLRIAATALGLKW